MNARAEWLDQRRSGIGSSDVAAILGMAPPSWGASPHSVWLDKLGLATERETVPAMTWGSDVEPAILRYVAREHSLDIRPNAGLWQHPTEPWAVATPDAIHWRDAPTGIVEVKNYGVSDGWGQDGDEAGDETVPAHVRLQAWHQMWVTGLRGQSYIAASLWGRPPRLYPLAWEPAYERVIVPQLRAFWRLVEDRTPPAVDASRACAEALRMLHPLRDEVAERPDLEALAVRLVEAKRAAKAAEEAAALAANELLAAVGSTRRTVAGPCLVTRVAVKGRVTLDAAAALQADMPDLWERYARVGRASEYLKVTLKKGASDGK